MNPDLKQHPALILFSALFEKASIDPGPVLPGYFVPLGSFMRELEKAGIDHPNNVIEFWEWQDKIGLRKHVSKVIAAHHRKHGTKPTPMERGARRLDAHLRRHS